MTRMVQGESAPVPRSLPCVLRVPSAVSPSSAVRRCARLGRFVTAVLLAMGAPSVVPAQVVTTVPEGDPGLGRLGAELQRLAELSGGTVGVAAIHLETGRELYVSRGEHFPMASTYKVPIAVQLLSRVDRGEISLADMIELRPEDLHPGSGTLSNLLDDPGVILSVHNLLELMILISDNSATDLTLRTAGGQASVNARLAELGVEGVRVDRPTSLLIADYVGVSGVPADGAISLGEFRAMAAALDDGERARAAEAFASDARDTATPEGMGDLLRKIWQGDALGPERTELLLDVMRRVTTGAARIRGLLPPYVTVAHKTGTIGGTTNDVGIIELPGDAGNVVTVVFVKDSTIETPRRERAIAQIARAIYDYFLFCPEG